MIRFKSFLTEAATTDATRAEMAICVSYNMKKGKMNEKDAVKAAKIPSDKWRGVSKSIRKVGDKVVEALLERRTNLGKTIVHAGGSSAKTKYPKPASDNTSKSDLYGNSKHQCSLKKAGDSSEAAQLMSAKGGEAAGVFLGGLTHFKATNPKMPTPKGFNKIVEQLGEDMNEKVDNALYVKVGRSRKSFLDWYASNDNERYQEIENWIEKNITKLEKIPRWAKKLPTEKDILAHMKDEAGNTGATPKTAGKNIIHPDIMISKADIEDYIAGFEQDKTYDIGGAKVSSQHLAKADPQEIKAPALKEKIGWILRTSMEGREIQENIKSILSEELENSVELRKWIVYEAASGLYKFTKQAATKGDYFGGRSTAVANKILVFSDNGAKYLKGVYKWSMSHGNLVNTLNVNFKGSGTTRYLRVGMATDAVVYMPPSGSEFLYERSTPQIIYPEKEVDSIIDEEYTIFQQTLNQLSLEEGFGDWLKGKWETAKQAAINIANKIKEAVRNFYENVIKRFLNKLLEWAQKGTLFLIKVFGWDVEGESTVSTPTW